MVWVVQDVECTNWASREMFSRPSDTEQILSQSPSMATRLRHWDGQRDLIDFAAINCSCTVIEWSTVGEQGQV